MDNTADTLGEEIPDADASLDNGETKKTSETDMEDATDVEETPDAKMEAIDTLKKLKNNKPQNGAKSDITRL